MKQFSILMSIKVNKFNFVKIFSVQSNKKFETAQRKTRKRILVFIGFSVLVLTIFLSLNFTTSELTSSNNNEGTKTPTIDSNALSQKNQNSERFGNAISINPDQIEPEVLEPILENYNNIPKP